MRQNNFAIFAEGTKPIWTYGDSLTSEFIENTVNFLNGLDGMGKELFGSGVASIELDWRNISKDTGIYIKTKEVFVISLFSQFFFIASDPLTTIQLIEQESIPKEVEDVIRGVLVGQASVLYSNSYMEAENSQDQDKVDELFRSTVLELGIPENKLDSIVDKGRCSFASFSFSQMLIFHYLLRKIFSKKFSKTEEWGIIADSSGSPIYISHGNVQNSTSLAGYLSVLLMFCMELFQAPPKSIVFGGDNLIPLEMVNGVESFCAFSSWHILFKNQEFLNKILELKEKTNDLEIPIAKFLAEKLSLLFEMELQQWAMPYLISLYQGFNESVDQLKSSNSTPFRK